jgi:hypothetical protein
MATIRSGTLAALALTLLADVAPSPSSCGSGCRSDSTSQYTYFEVKASDCACAPGTIQVRVDDQLAGTITCGPSGAVSLQVSAGAHAVSAQSATGSWPPQSKLASPGRRTPVELGCPSK